MKRPHTSTQPRPRDVTGEIVYLDESRRQNEEPKPFLELGDLAIQMYEAEADMFTDGTRPGIMSEYEHYDYTPSEVAASCVALANELLALKEPDSTFAFVDIVVEPDPKDIIESLAAISAGTVLAGDDVQLAIPSNGEYYPILDMCKQHAKLVGAGLRVWGWDSQKYVFTNKEDEQYKYPDHLLVYPSNEKSSTRQLELSFSYRSDDGNSFTESVSLYISENGATSISSQVWASAYAETGYEGHGGTSLQDITDEDIAAFGDLIAEIVGDEPMTVSMRTNRRLLELAATAATVRAQQAIHALIELTWPAQANYFLTRRQEGEDKTIAELLADEATADAAIAAINQIMADWKSRR